jgi:hypothetical protein
MTKHIYSIPYKDISIILYQLDPIFSRHGLSFLHLAGADVVGGAATKVSSDLKYLDVP